MNRTIVVVGSGNIRVAAALALLLADVHVTIDLPEINSLDDLELRKLGAFEREHSKSWINRLGRNEDTFLSPYLREPKRKAQWKSETHGRSFKKPR